MSRPPLRVGVLGAGTVGSAVLDGLLHHADRLVTADGAPLTVVAVAVRDCGEEPRGRADGPTC
jgi:homoserine dehydrogenase